jgi:hypothetical protein
MNQKSPTDRTEGKKELWIELYSPYVDVPTTPDQAMATPET